jgi:flotillin
MRAFRDKARRTMGLEDLILPVGELAGTVAATGALAWAYYKLFYVPVPPNRALVLFGHRASAPRTEAGRLPKSSETEVRRPRIVVGGGAFVAPWNKGVGHLSLDPVDVDLIVRSIHGLEGSRASGWETRLRVQAKIPTDPGLLVTAAENLLGKSEEDLRTIVRHAVEGVVPAVLARLRPESGEPDWERLAAEIQAAVAPDLIALGLVVRTLSVTELHRISPTEPSAPTAQAPPVRSEPSVGDSPKLGSALATLDSRLARAERSLGIMGAEVLRMAREATSSVEGSTSSSVADFPLGYGASEATLAAEAPTDPTHDSMGGELSPRSGRPSEEGRPVEGGVNKPRPPLNEEL